MTPARKPNRRGFLKTGAVAGGALTLTAQSYAKVAGANGKINVGFVGVGGRCQQHLDILLLMKKLGKNAEPYAVCDVWDGDQTKGAGKGQGLFPSAKRCGIPEGDKTRVARDYRALLDNKDIDVIAVASPDHWHAKQACDAMEAGKHVYCEKPMTRTIDEAQAVVDTWKKTGMVMSVGVQSMADPTWLKANELIRNGRIGHVVQAQTRYYRNSNVGQWRYYSLTKSMNPKTIDWDTFLGHKSEFLGRPIGPKPEEVPFDRSVYAQWRCYWPFGGGMFTDLFVHQTTHMLAAMGLRFPSRVVGAGGIYLEYDGRDVPDVATVIADFEEGAQFMVSATMCNDTQLGEIIRGRLATIKFNGGGDYIKGFDVFAQGLAGGPQKPKSDTGTEKPVHTFTNEKTGNATYALWENFLGCVRDNKRETLSTPELGAAAFSTVNMGVQSYRQGKVLFWDKEKRAPKEADASWSSQWEARSKKRGKPNNIIGWTGGDKGNTITPPEYQKLEGPWVNGDPAAGGQ